METRQEKKHATKVDDVPLRFGLNLRVVSNKHAPVRRVASAVCDCGGGHVLNVADGALRFDVRPLLADFDVEGLEIVSSSLLLQIRPKPPQLPRLWVLLLLRLQPGDFAGKLLGEHAVIGDGLGDGVKAILQTSHPTDADVVFGCAAPELVRRSRLLAELPQVSPKTL